MKGVILRIAPEATIVDITHDVPPQAVAHAAFVLGATCPFFPPHAVHVAVVDPGVGTERDPLLLVTPGGLYVAPDNGVLTYVLTADVESEEPDAESAAPVNMMSPVSVRVPETFQAYRLDRRGYWVEPVSNTFHGRDIFAPVAAHLSMGVSPEEVGQPLNSVTGLSIPSPQVRGDSIEGRIIHVDRFGNLVSNIRLASSSEFDVTEVEIEGSVIQGLSESYASGEALLAIIGSSGYLEVAARDGSAAQELGAGMGSEVTVRCSDWPN